MCPELKDLLTTLVNVTDRIKELVDEPDPTEDLQQQLQGARALLVKYQSVTRESAARLEMLRAVLDGRTPVSIENDEGVI